MSVKEYFKDDWEYMNSEYYIYSSSSKNKIFNVLWENSEYLLFKKYYEYKGTEDHYYLSSDNVLINIVEKYIDLKKWKVLSTNKINEEIMFMKHIMTTNGSIRLIQLLKEKSVDYRKFL